MTESNVWIPKIEKDLHILIVTKPNFFNDDGFSILSKVFSIEQTVESTYFYFDGSYKTESRLVQFIEGRPKNNVLFIDNYRHQKLDFGLVFGGDGSILWANKHLKEYPYDLPIVTFNFGSVGFISKFTFDELDDVLDSIKSLLINEVSKTKFCIEYYTKLYSVIKDQNGKEVKQFSSINEIIVEKLGAYSSWLDIDVDGIHLATFNADGILLSTQLGSTAYNASIGGPFLFP